MTTRTMIVAGLSTAGAAAAATAAVWLTVAPQSGAAPGDAAPGTPAEPAGPDSQLVLVCVGADRVVRAPGAGDRCPAGHRAVSLEPDDEGVCELCPPLDDPKPSNADRDPDLERRLRALENAPYFEVVDTQERPVFRVGPDGVRVFNKAGAAVAAFGATQDGGYFSVRSGTHPVETSLVASDITAGVRIAEERFVRLDLMARENGGSVFRVPSAGGVVAGFGESAVGAGILVLGTIGGQIKTSMTVPDGRGMIQVKNEEKGGGLSLLEAGIGGGMLDLADSRGQAAVRMGHVEQRYGIVLAGPVLGLPLVPKSGLPGSFFMGCGSQAPPACMPVVP